MVLFDQMLGQIEERALASLLEQVDWVSLGGGIHLTGEGYPLECVLRALQAVCPRR